MAKIIDIRLKPGERGLIVGQSGSGKTYAAAWMLRFSSQRVVVFDTKYEPVFERIPQETESLEIVETKSDMLKKLGDKKHGPDYIIVRPNASEISDPMLLDGYLESIYHTQNNILVYIDEAYQIHKNTQAGPGLIGLLTRGRARGLTTLVSTQRPAWISRFCLTEAQKFYIYRLTDAKDWARLGEIIPEIPKGGIRMEPYFYLYYKQGEENFERMKPLPMVADLGYTPQAPEEPARRKWY
jgi:energy-coupling factor transporter ATP-binding protein EcfA2